LLYKKDKLPAFPNGD